MTAHTLVEDEYPAGRPYCWCCGSEQPAEAMVRLGSHPEVTVCQRCAHSLNRQAAAKEGKPVARLAWRIRRTVVRKGWQHSRLLGPPLRWLGNRLP